LAVIRAAVRYEPRALVRTYLYGIALKLLAQERRREAKDLPAPEESQEPVSPAINDASETVLWVRQALEKLDGAEREILMLREYEQLSYGEIAQLLRIPVNTVRSWLFRARMALKSSLQQDAGSSRARDKAALHRPSEEEKKPIATKLRASEEGISQ